MITHRRNSGAVAEELVDANFSYSPLLTCFHMKFSCRNPVQKLTRHTLVRGVLGDVQGSGSTPIVAEHEGTTSPRMRIGNFNVAGIARSNFEPGVNINRRVAILNYVARVNVMNVGNGIDVAVMALGG